MLDKLVVILLSYLNHVFGDVFDFNIDTEIVIVIIGLHNNKVDYSFEIGLRAYRELNGNRVAFKAFLHHIDNAIEVSTHNVHLINIDHSGNMVFVSLSPDGFRLRLNTTLCAENSDGTIKHSEGTLNLNGEVNVTGSVNDVYAMVLPKTGCRSGCDCDSSLLLLLHPVHCCGAIVRFAYFMSFSCIEQDTLCCGCFAGVNVRHDTNVSGHLKRYLSWHKNLRIILKYSFIMRRLPPEMCKCLVGLCHLVSILTLLECRTG